MRNTVTKNKMPYIDRFEWNTTALQVLHNENLKGKVYLITGATKGIGYEIARSLAVQGATIILCGSTAGTTTTARIQIQRNVPNADITAFPVNLTSLRNVEKFCSSILAKYQKLDGLILNAGISNSDSQLTEDDLDKIFQVNFLSHFYMTIQLSSLLGEGSRVVCMTSNMYRHSNLSLSNLSMRILNPKQSWTSFMYSYANSKLCMILLAKELARKLGGKGVRAYSVHPGVCMTEIHGWLSWLTFTLFRRNKKTPAQAASGAVYAAISKDLDEHNGGFIVNTKLENVSTTNAQDASLAEFLWTFSINLLESKNLL